MADLTMVMGVTETKKKSVKDSTKACALLDEDASMTTGVRNVENLDMVHISVEGKVVTRQKTQI